MTQAFTVSNTGDGDVVVGTSTLSGPDVGAFAFVSGKNGFTIVPGGANVIEVRFNAPTEGLKTATLTIPSNDPDENPVTIQLTGTGGPITPPVFMEMRQGGSAGSGQRSDIHQPDGRQRRSVSGRDIDETNPYRQHGHGTGSDLDARVHAVRRAESDGYRALVGAGGRDDRQCGRDARHGADECRDCRHAIFRRRIDEPGGPARQREHQWCQRRVCRRD